jgi:hypothetical protein
MQGLGLLLFLIALFWFWYTSAKARESALLSVQQTLQQSDLQLLDGTIYLKKLWPARLQNGVMGMLRFYHFEYTANGADRYQGLVVMAANRLEYLQIEKDGHTVVTTAADDNEINQ